MRKIHEILRLHFEQKLGQRQIECPIDSRQAGEVQQGQLLMTQAERDRLVALKKAKKKLITQKEAAQELGITERHVRRLLQAMTKRGDKAVVHALRGLPSNRQIEEKVRSQAVELLSQDVYRGFGPTLAAEYLNDQHGVKVGRETTRQWMIAAKLWRVRPQHVEKVHQWRPRRTRFGELVQWDTSEHDWLEGRGDQMLLIAMLDDATSRWFARFVKRRSEFSAVIAYPKPTSPMNHGSSINATLQAK